MIQLDNVTKTYNNGNQRLTVLDDFTLNIKPGEFVALMGESGSGKSTLLLCVGGMLTPSSGTVRIDGTDLYAMSANRRAGFRASQMGFVFQQFHLIPYLNVRENILAPTIASGNDATARADEMITRFGLESRVKHVPAKLSTGERQRVALARALINQPKLLLADEPTGNLDEDNAKTVLQAFRDFAQAGGAVLLVSHDRSAAAAADRTLHLAGGRKKEA